jgi:RNA polymerase sigma-70 factor (ECF subfamily)
MFPSLRKRATETAKGPSPAPLATTARIEAMVREYLPQVWRLARRNGLSEADADDVAQRAMVIAAQRIVQIEVGKERAFLYSTLLFLIRNLRRDRNRHPHETLDGCSDLQAFELDPERLVEQRRARERLDRILSELPEELRVVFTLYEFESLSQSEIAEMLRIPTGTVASRLKRAREQFTSILHRESRPHVAKGALS